MLVIYFSGVNYMCTFNITYRVQNRMPVVKKPKHLMTLFIIALVFVCPRLVLFRNYKSCHTLQM